MFCRIKATSRVFRGFLVRSSDIYWGCSILVGFVKLWDLSCFRGLPFNFYLFERFGVSVRGGASEIVMHSPFDMCLGSHSMFKDLIFMFSWRTWGSIIHVLLLFASGFKPQELFFWGGLIGVVSVFYLPIFVIAKDFSFGADENSWRWGCLNLVVKHHVYVDGGSGILSVKTLRKRGMKGGKDEGKPMDPLFPRLHINDADKGGPRPPPRNKMALCEQYNVHPQSSKLRSGPIPMLPLPPTNGCSSFVSQASSSNVS